MNITDFISTEGELEDIFTYLDVLRESGITNMYGAGTFLQDEFCFDRKEASAVLTAWMKTFSRDVSASERAAKAFREEVKPNATS